MATLKTSLIVVAAVAACGKPVGLNGPVRPLASIHVVVTGDPAIVAPSEPAPNLRVALLWGLQWRPEPFCFLPPESSAMAALLAAGCPDSFGFVPNRVGADVAVQPGVPASIELIDLPAADVMVGDITGRVAYASLVVYDDRNGNGVLDTHRPRRRRHDDSQANQPPPEDAGPPATRDAVYGASFISMTQPDRRIAFREGSFDPTVAFYPRANCEGPPSGFSILSAGGFTASAALQASVLGQLPAEDPATCAIAPLNDTISIALQAPGPLSQLACTQVDTDGVSYYRQAPADKPDLTTSTWACASFPHLSGDDAGAPTGKQLLVAGNPNDPCRSVVHYTLRGCDNDPMCVHPSWDITATPPSWWPCSTSP